LIPDGVREIGQRHKRRVAEIFCDPPFDIHPNDPTETADNGCRKTPMGSRGRLWERITPTMRTRTKRKEAEVAPQYTTPALKLAALMAEQIKTRAKIEKALEEYVRIEDEDVRAQVASMVEEYKTRFRAVDKRLRIVNCRCLLPLPVSE
jgi:hypothetical protein